MRPTSSSAKIVGTQLTVITEDVVRSIATLDLAFEAVVAALQAVAADEARILPVVLAEAGKPGAAFGVKTATHLSAERFGLVTSAWSDRQRAGSVLVT